jgi:photosynthetic reaction center cytochrome c subunit
MNKLVAFSMALILIIISLSSVSFSPGKTNHNKSFVDTLEEERLKYVKQVLESIKGKEKMNADSVFKNIQLFKGTKNFTAEHFLMMMDFGWGKGLGVNCTYCHDPAKWESDEKRTKLIAREMYGIRQVVNDKLKTIQGLQSPQPLINCGTCHQGRTIPDKNW